MSLWKFSFFRDGIGYVGHVIAPGNFAISDKKAKDIRCLKQQKVVTELRVFWGWRKDFFRLFWIWQTFRPYQKQKVIKHLLSDFDGLGSPENHVSTSMERSFYHHQWSHIQGQEDGKRYILILATNKLDVCFYKTKQTSCVVLWLLVLISK